MIALHTSKLLARSVVRPSIAQAGLFASRPSSSTAALFSSSTRVFSARPDTASGQRGDHAQGPVEGAGPSPEINVGRSQSTLRILVPSVAVMLAFIGWWFLGHDDKADRMSRINVGPDGTNKLKGSKAHAAEQLAKGERDASGKQVAPTTTSSLIHK